jgi:dephospho-CoA kinase
MIFTLVIVGPSCAGKGTTSAYLKTKGYRPVLWSDIVRDVVPRLFPAVRAESIFDKVDTVREKFGTAYFAKEIDNLIAKKQFEKVVIDGLRHPDEVLYFKQLGIPILGIDAPYIIREERYLARKRLGDVTFGGFAVYDKKDRGLLPNQTVFSSRVDDCMQLTDHVLQNDGSKEILFAKIARVMKIFGLN